MEVAKQGLVVLVDKDGDTLATHLAGAADDTHETDGEAGIRTGLAAVKLFPYAELGLKQVTEHIHAVVFLRVEAEVKHGAYRPLLLQLLDGETVEELALTLKVGLEGG